jgi:flagellar basal-body rod protein FlgF
MQITEIAAQILARAEDRAEIAAQNITNASTPGYRRRISFSEMMAPAQQAGVERHAPVRTGAAADFTAGQLTETGSPTDIAIGGQGFFAVRGGETILYTRQGQFRRDTEGRLATPQGLVLQTVEGADLVVGSAPFEVAVDGTVTRNGEPLARIALVDFEDRALLTANEGGAFSAGDAAPLAVAHPAIRQGMLESSNVNMGDEMVAMMEAVRRAETGQRLVTTYDDLMGRALNLFGQN